MFKFFTKYKLLFDFLTIGIWLFIALVKFFFEDNPEQRNWDLFFGMLCLVMAIFKIWDVVGTIKAKKTE